MILAFIAACAVAVFRIALYLSDVRPEGFDFMLVHFLALVTVTFFTGERLIRKRVPPGFPDLMRECFKSAALYALSIGLFVWLFYSRIDTDHFRLRVDEMVLRGMMEGQKEELIRPALEQFFTPFNYATITFFALMVSSAIISFIVAVVHHKVLRHFRR
jgi:hypothetical protein